VSPRLHTQTHGLTFPSQPRYISFKVPRNEPPPSRSPLRSPCIEKDCCISRALFAYLSKPPGKKSPLRVPPRKPLPRERCSVSRALLTYVSKFLEQGSPLQVPLSQPHRNRRSVPRTFLYLSLEVPGERAPPPSRFPIGAPMERDAHHQGLLRYHLESPGKEPPSRFPSQSPRRE
jgi:hypothetical protein